MNVDVGRRLLPETVFQHPSKIVISSLTNLVRRSLPLSSSTVSYNKHPRSRNRYRSLVNCAIAQRMQGPVSPIFAAISPTDRCIPDWLVKTVLARPHGSFPRTAHQKPALLLHLTLRNPKYPNYLKISEVLEAEGIVCIGRSVISGNRGLLRRGGTG
jgi:hypothetical protein